MRKLLNAMAWIFGGAGCCLLLIVAILALSAGPAFAGNGCNNQATTQVQPAPQISLAPAQQPAQVSQVDPRAVRQPAPTALVVSQPQTCSSGGCGGGLLAKMRANRSSATQVTTVRQRTVTQLN